MMALYWPGLSFINRVSVAGSFLSGQTRHGAEIATFRSLGISILHGQRGEVVHHPAGSRSSDFLAAQRLHLAPFFDYEPAVRTGGP